LISLEYLNAKLAKAAKIPSLKKIMGDQKPPTMKSIVDKLKAAPKFQQVD
jgi:hypothetical protein